MAHEAASDSDSDSDSDSSFYRYVQDEEAIEDDDVADRAELLATRMILREHLDTASDCAQAAWIREMNSQIL